MASIQRPYDKICIVTYGNVKIIYKLSTMDESVKAIETEYFLIRHMAKIDNAFETFDNYLYQEIIDNKIFFPILEHNLICHLPNLFRTYKTRFQKNKITMMYTILNTKLVTLYNYINIYNHTAVKNIYKVLDIIHRVFRPNNFIHGDCKLDNIMINSSDYSLKIIDLEFSLLCQDINKITNEDECMIALYLGENLILDERYLQLFDIYILCASLVVCRFVLPLNILKAVRNNILNNEIMNETMMDFAVIYIYLFVMGRDKLLNDKGNVIGTYDFINKILLNTIDYSLNDIYDKHVIKIQNIIMTNIALNTRSNDPTTLITVESDIDLTISESDEHIM